MDDLRFTSFTTVVQSYQDDGRMIMKGCVQWNSVYGWEDFASSGDRTRAPRSVGQRLTHGTWANLYVFPLFLQYASLIVSIFTKENNFTYFLYAFWNDV